MNMQAERIQAEEEDGITLTEIIDRLRARWRWIASAGVLGLVIGLGVALALPVMYTANTKFLPPSQGQQGAGAAILAQLGGLAGLAGAGGALKTPADLYVGLLKTRTISDRLIGKFDLQAVYEQKLISKVRKRLASATVISAGKDGLVSIDVDDTDPVRAAKLANAYVEELVHMSKTMALTEAAQRRAFFEGQLADANRKLADAQEAARIALGRHGLQAVEAQGKTVMETSAKLRAQITAQEVRIASMGNRLAPANTEFIAMQDELQALRRQLTKLEGGAAVTGPEQAEGAKTAILLRDAKYYETLYELLAKQLEVARLDEARQPAVVQVVDVAEAPDMKSKPARTLIVLASLFGFLLVAAALSVILGREGQASIDSHS